jgi:hypothetical protein
MYIYPAQLWHAAASDMRYLLELQKDTTAFTMNSVAVNPEGSWLSFALTDAALLHATLSLVAYHYDITHGRDESLDCLYQKGEAIKKMNQRLGDSHQQFTDTTVATVSLFANIEVYTISTQRFVWSTNRGKDNEWYETYFGCAYDCIGEHGYCTRRA